ncbi:hypothetical protein AB0A63_31280 [Lentzea sp. NPDC042327]|uniref:hypothetical protein n=1 Tax=Lentzea sp. NPDC042327 TaxID=3154801 RepID=UPI0033F09E9C
MPPTTLSARERADFRRQVGVLADQAAEHGAVDDPDDLGDEDDGEPDGDVLDGEVIAVNHEPFPFGQLPPGQQ